MSSSAWAVENTGGMELSSWLRAYPAIAIEAVSDSNFYWTAENEESVQGAILYPELELRGLIQKTSFNLKVEGAVSDYDNGSLDDFADSEVDFSFDYEANSRNTLGFRLNNTQSHDAFGTRRTRDLSDIDRELDEFTLDSGNFHYRFGAKEALVNLEYNFDVSSKNYDTNRELGTEFLDYDFDAHTVLLTYNNSPKSALAVRASVGNIEYPDTSPGLAARDATETRVALGAIWRATAKTSGRVFIGYLGREPDSSAYEDFSALDWDVAVDWRPRTSSQFELRTSRQTEESYILDSSFLNIERYSLLWRQSLGAKFIARYKLQYANITFENSEREDDVLSQSLSLDYLLTRRATLYSKYTYTDRDSSFGIREFDKQYFTLGLSWKY
ncbi:outer membrane beta-barrel protein [Zhongshania aquimaris]|uniref:Outer membrane beta-barrel protein n=1 Tax=Zhongshania aquimaris TaxID=2857107 RepID=A0ABS6VN32_9GAMM|nr:outer membrane beta-barrel protein [Zhongshania aquimaris]MBW2939723.1 outer membrane beta-barrel protein [Zhongshania aquimaris]